MLVVVVASLLTVAAPECLGASAVPVVAEGRVQGALCPDAAVAAGLTLLDLSDDWVPLVLRETPEAAEWIALANESWTAVRGARAVQDRFFDLWGIPPSLSVMAARLGDDLRFACHAAVDDEPLRRGPRLRAGRRWKAEEAAVRALQAHLVCDRLLAPDDADGDFGAATAEALAAFQRREALVGSGAVLDDDTRARLLEPAELRDLRALLRVLRERVVDATGLIEDGSASGEPGTVVGVALDAPSLLRARRPPSVDGAPDRIAAATDAAARALGFVSVNAARRALAALPRGTVAVRLPPLPRWTSSAMDLTVAIERGSTTTMGTPMAGGDRPVLTLLARVDDGAYVPLVRWPTTIGGAQREKIAGGGIVVKPKPSPTGRFVWRFLWAAPAWFAPPTTPDDELVVQGRAGPMVNEEGIGPGYRSAYGLVMLQHHVLDVAPDGTRRFIDTGVRTHGTGNVRSVLQGGVSHGCHRILPVHAIRLGGFLLRHRTHGPAERVREGWSRDLDVGGVRLHARRSERGVRYELIPPVEVRVDDEICPNG